MLEVKNLTFQVNENGIERSIVENISFNVKDGEMLVITGPNGGGKSTLAKVLMGIDQASAGQIILDGTDISDYDINHRAEAGIGYAFQQPPRFKGMTVSKLLSLAAGEDLTRDVCCRLLSTVGLCANEYIEREVDGTLSGGEMKRLEIATVLAKPHKLCIFDEPMPRIEWNKENMKYTMCFFPLIGVVTGVLIYLAGMFLDGNIFPKVNSGRLMFAAVMTLIPVFVSGGIHLDGFMDTMDALGSWGDKEKKLEILKDSHNGAFAVIGICCYFTVSLGVWSEIRTEMLPVVAAGYVISRALSGIAVVTFPAARGSGLVKTFQDGAQKKAVRITMIVYLILAAVYLYFCSPVGMVVLLIIAGVVFGYYYRMSRKQFGGVTGDLAGYFLQICELALLVGGLIVQGIK